MKLVFVGQPSGWSKEADAVYQKKISGFLPFEAQALKPYSADRDSAELKREKESQLILKKLSPTDYVILLDERGKALSSLRWAEALAPHFDAKGKSLLFVIGGAFGVSEELASRAQFRWSLSPMTLSHEIARVVLLEQIYRSLCIWRKLPYHNV